MNVRFRTWRKQPITSAHAQGTFRGDLLSPRFSDSHHNRTHPRSQRPSPVEVNVQSATSVSSSNSACQAEDRVSETSGTIDNVETESHETETDETGETGEYKDHDEARARNDEAGAR